MKGLVAAAGEADEGVAWWLLQRIHLLEHLDNLDTFVAFNGGSAHFSVF